jgi:hypothetical protein
MDLKVFFYFFLLNELQRACANPFVRVRPNETVRRFSHAHSSTYANMMSLDNSIYVSGLNYVFKLDAHNVSNRDPKVYYERRFDLNNTYDNQIRYLARRDTPKDIVICTTNHDHPQILHLKQKDLSFLIEYNGAYLCPGVSEHKGLAKLVFDDTDLKYEPNGIMYSAVWITDKPSVRHGNYSRYGIFRKDTETDEHFLRSLYNRHWLWEPRFVAIVDDPVHVYYFMTEYSIEDNSGHEQQHPVRCSRIVRVCKNDKGSGRSSHINRTLHQMWTTLRKIKFTCRYEANDTVIVLNNLVDVYQLDANNLVAIFHADLFGHVESVLCELTLSQLNLMFAKQWIFLGNQTMAGLEHFDCLNVTRNETDHEDLYEIYEFLAVNTILDGRLVVQPNYHVTFVIAALDVVKLSGNNSILMHVATLDGNVLRFVRTIHATGVRYELLLTWAFDMVSTSGIVVDMSTQFMYLSGKDAIVQVNLSGLCLNYAYCSACIKDPQCHWSNEDFECVARENKTSMAIDHQYPLAADTYCLEMRAKHSLLVGFRRNDTLVLDCMTRTLDRSERLWTLNNVEWFANSTQISGNKINYRIDQNGSLILLAANANYMGTYYCAFRDDRRQFVTVRNYTLVWMTEMSYEQTSECDRLSGSFEKWTNEYSKYISDLNEYNSARAYMNC